MHYWGDEWFKEHGNELYTAIDEIEHEMRKYRIGINGKEKWGCYVPEYLQFWDCGIYELIWGYRMYCGTWGCKGLYKFKWFTNFINAIHHFIRYKIDEGMPRYKEGESFEETKRKNERKLWFGIKYYMYQIGITKLIWKWQESKVNKAYQIVCKKHPDIIEELTCDGYTPYRMIKPCRYGQLDGKELEKKYWK